ncbi:TINAGL1 [Branchiostoma lanceolatum]|uniref:TINAGL1 protein n=1 Tax=Branchiostoma lanceolatum TaxID=7740 RepID=A0A8J9ZKH7_BRALA|nr:TINAGL1 [Branchiostoma lanceolatum]
MRTMTCLGLCVAFMVTFVHVESQQQPNLVFREPPRAVTERYCSLLNCCRGRSDSCSLPYFDTICYCDEFCNRTSASDCCPDYRSECLGLPPPNEPTPLPQPPETVGCFHEGTYHPGGATVRINCNQCVCQPTQAGSYEFRCQENPCLLRPTMLEAINQGDYGWQAEAYPFLYGLTLDQGLQYKLGTDPVPESVHAMRGIQVSIRESLPELFDARRRWPGLIQDVRDQGNCGASWAFSTTAVLADRLAIQSRGTMAVTLSPQNLLSCNTNRQRGCQGGRLDRAWWFLRKKGFPASEVSDEPQDERRRLFKAALITALLALAVTTVVVVKITVQLNTTADETNLPPYRSWGYSDTRVPDDMTSTDCPPTESLVPTDHVRPDQTDGGRDFDDWSSMSGESHVRGKNVPVRRRTRKQTEVHLPDDDLVASPTDHVRRRHRFKPWDLMTSQEKHSYIVMMRLRIDKYMNKLLHREDEPKLRSDFEADNHARVRQWPWAAETFPNSESPTAPDDPVDNMSQLAPKPGSFPDVKPKSEIENTEKTAFDKVLSFIMTNNMTCRERKHLVLRRIKGVTRLALVVVGVLVVGSLITMVTTDACYPYTSGNSPQADRCAVPRSNGRPYPCPSNNGETTKKYQSSPAYKISNKEEDIMKEIMTNGPVQATMEVKPDLFSYRSGVYRHTELAQGEPPEYRRRGWHSVRIIGWGVEMSNPYQAPIKYWTVANSWGKQWGEDGFFRIVRGENECQIESFVLGVWGKVNPMVLNNRVQRRRRRSLK